MAIVRAGARSEVDPNAGTTNGYMAWMRQDRRTENGREVARRLVGVLFLAVLR